MNPTKLEPEVTRRGKQILRLLIVFAKAINHLEKVKPLRARERSRRWRANYDLVLAQLYWYQFRLFEYGIGMDQFVRLELKNRLTKNKKHNVWWISEDRSRNSRRMVLPDKVNQKRFNISPEQLKAKMQFALAQLRDVQERHPGTPWAKRAAWEARRPVSVSFGSRYQPPPKPGKRGPPRPKLTPRPKL